MYNENIKSAIENMVDDSTLELPARTINKLCKLADELRTEDVTLEEIREEFKLLIPASMDEDDDNWEEFVEELSNYIYEFSEE